MLSLLCIFYERSRTLRGLGSLETLLDMGDVQCKVSALVLLEHPTTRTYLLIGKDV